MDTPTRLKALGRSKSLKAIQIAGNPSSSSEVDVLRQELETLKGQVRFFKLCRQKFSNKKFTNFFFL
jgi:hypothetical protein